MFVPFLKVKKGVCHCHSLAQVPPQHRRGLSPLQVCLSGKCTHPFLHSGAPCLGLAPAPPGLTGAPCTELAPVPPGLTGAPCPGLAESPQNSLGHGRGTCQPALCPRPFPLLSPCLPPRCPQGISLGLPFLRRPHRQCHCSPTSTLRMTPISLSSRALPSPRVSQPQVCFCRTSHAPGDPVQTVFIG